MMNIKSRGGLLGLKDFKMILRVTTAQIYISVVKHNLVLLVILMKIMLSTKESIKDWDQQDPEFSPIPLRVLGCDASEVRQGLETNRASGGSLVQRTIQGQKNKLKTKLFGKNNPPDPELIWDNPPMGVSLDDWRQYIKYISSEKFVNWSSKNKANRAKLPYSSNLGTISYAASRYVEAIEEDWCIPRPSRAVPEKAYERGTVGQLGS
ncbi:hypothetical protein Tco_0697626 [Tanacetum coccineum]